MSEKGDGRIKSGTLFGEAGKQGVPAGEVKFAFLVVQVGENVLVAPRVTLNDQEFVVFDEKGNSSVMPKVYGMLSEALMHTNQAMLLSSIRQGLAKIIATEVVDQMMTVAGGKGVKDTGMFAADGSRLVRTPGGIAKVAAKPKAG